MHRFRRIRRHLVRLLPPILLMLALMPPAANAAREAPSQQRAHECMDGLAHRWIDQLPSELIIRKGAGAAIWTQTLTGHRMWEAIWRDYTIAGAWWHQYRWARAWVEEGTVGCTWGPTLRWRKGTPVTTGRGPSPYRYPPA